MAADITKANQVGPDFYEMAQRHKSAARYHLAKAAAAVTESERRTSTKAAAASFRVAESLLQKWNDTLSLRDGIPTRIVKKETALVQSV